jgi:hypothetical protein
MWFHLFTGNHNPFGAASLHDMMDWLTASLTELNQEVTVGDTLAPNAINIIWENFVDTDFEIFDTHHFTFGLVATEIPTDRTFNWLPHEPWLTRRRCFDQIAPRAAFIWSMMNEPMKHYRQWAPVGFLEMGFSEGILDDVFLQEPEFDFGFYGLNISPHRSQMLQKLRAHCTITTPTRFLMGRELNKFIASFKVGLCLKHMPNWPVSSPCRLSRLLHAKRGAAAEYVPIQTGPSVFVSMAAENQDFASFCIDCVKGSWKQRAEEAYERFRAAMPMKTIMERLLDETVSMASPSINSLATRDDGCRAVFKFGGAARRSGDDDRAYAHLANVPIDRIQRMTAELQQGAGGDVDAATVSLLLNDYTAAFTHLRAVARLAEERIAAAAGPIRDASKLVRRALKSARNA